MASAAQRAAWRKAKRRQRQVNPNIGRAKAGTSKSSGSRPGTKSSGSGLLPQDTAETSSYGVFEPLQALLADPETPASAKVNAARTIAEMQGLIGRHQSEPERAAPSLSVLSRDQLVAELEHLRTVLDLGLVR
jgi:hypothetical protein